MFKRIHYSGTEAFISEHQDGWRILLNLREANHNPMSITGYMARTAEMAKGLADNEIRKYGHVCNESCKAWEEFSDETPLRRQASL